MKKSCFLATGILVFVALFSLYYIKSEPLPEDGENYLANAFKSTGAAAVNSEIYFWGKVGKNLEETASVRKLVDKLADELHISGISGYSSRTYTEDSMEVIQAKGINAQNALISVEVSRSTEQQGKGERYITVSVKQDRVYQNLADIRKEVGNVLGRHGIKTRTNVCITGIFEGRLARQELNDKCNDAFRQVDATRVEGISDRNLISISAYSPVLGKPPAAEGSKVNLNLALRYNFDEHKTYIWMATPVIMTEY